MFIKQIQKQNKKEGKIFYHYRLVESYRIDGKVLLRTILNPGEISKIQQNTNSQFIIFCYTPANKRD